MKGYPNCLVDDVIMGMYSVCTYLYSVI